jgi:hypothetical protein
MSLEDEFTFFVWQLNPYHKLFAAPAGEKVQSRAFALSSDPSIKFRINFYAKCPLDGFTQFIAMGLAVDKYGSQKSIDVKFSLWVESTNGRDVVRKGWEFF